jgi:uncharacterized protein (DUF1800 family)
MMRNRFFRKVGFGLSPQEDIPADPLAWAVEQVTKIPPLIWPEKQYTVAEMLVFREQFLLAEKELEQTVRDQNLLRKEREKIYQKYGRHYFESYELAIRHHQAVASRDAVFDRFQHFWGNHFAIVDKIKMPTFNTGAYQRETIRLNMDKRFADLVIAATLSFPMMRALDNFLSRGPNSIFGKNNKGKKNVNGLNENHGRELLELHTVSPQAGYTQEDVINAAYILTGWGMWDGDRKGSEGKEVTFEPSVHEPGTHKVLGRKYKPVKSNGQQGANQLKNLVEDLCSSPECISFISHKLCRHFICDEPTQSMINHVSAAWVKSEGHLIQIHTAVLEATFKWGSEYQKFQSPETWLLQTARMLGGDWPGSPLEFKFDFQSNPNNIMRQPARVLSELGHLPFRAQQPNGFPDDVKSWLSPEYLVRRLAIANDARRLGILSKTSEVSENLESALLKNFDDQNFWMNLKANITSTNPNDLVTAFMCSKEVLNS